MARPTTDHRIPLPTVRGWGLVVASVAAFVLAEVLHRHELVYLACFLLAVPLFSYLWVVLRRAPLSVQRIFTPESGSVGQNITVTLLVQNWGSLRTPTMLWSDEAGAPLLPSTPAVLPPLPGFASSALDTPVSTPLRYRLDTRSRGAHRVGPFTVSITDPFGCARRLLRVGSTDSVLVTPVALELARIDLRLATGDGAEQVSRRLVGGGEQDVIARKYLPGDSMRRVHWPATAKHGELMVRQDDQRNDQDAVVLLDAASFDELSWFDAAGASTGRAGRGAGAGASAGAGAGAGAGASGVDGLDELLAGGTGGLDADEVAFEWAVSAVASIAVHLMNEGFGVRVVGAVGESGATSADEVYVAPFGAARVLRDLAVVEPESLNDAAEFREAVDQASLTSPDAPPVFAVVADAPGAGDRIRDLATLSSHPVVFLVGGAAATSPGSTIGARRPRGAGRRPSEQAPNESSEAVALRGAGWAVVPCRPGDDLPALWKSLGAARGLS
ncbi:DUF58 domain-containing protein [Herbiconiux sp. KACC 21604]|uniref:DUF58 domain-containing protein n=1 Tax=unclassified Herbiconiux TaxID=2618217 RepID=UPI0014925255|nr:DUF58 domain-containing protein [Herbiconiux sp. SALV-R1]QJU53699.1 DUF58 domain-containing protein [Herbiconiux sp. SALV-R1]WPO84702.1 DUF58 domain-containing protein [Herbiconiux sp. KACC 21604]